MANFEDDAKRLFQAPTVLMLLQPQMYQGMTALGFLMSKQITKKEIAPFVERVRNMRNDEQHGSADAAAIHADLQVKYSKMYRSSEYNGVPNLEIGRRTWILAQRFRAAPPVELSRSPERARPGEPLTADEQRAYQLFVDDVASRVPEQDVISKCVNQRVITAKTMASIIDKKELAAVDTHKANKNDLCNIVLAEVVGERLEPSDTKRAMKERLVQLIHAQREQEFDQMCSSTYLLDGIKALHAKTGGNGEVGGTKQLACNTLKDQIKFHLTKRPRLNADAPADAPEDLVLHLLVLHLLRHLLRTRLLQPKLPTHLLRTRGLRPPKLLHLRRPRVDK
jgi:hypothetical protein